MPKIGAVVMTFLINIFQQIHIVKADSYSSLENETIIEKTLNKLSILSHLRFIFFNSVQIHVLRLEICI